jgi:uncharacterized protein (TIGR00730 family)
MNKTPVVCIYCGANEKIPSAYKDYAYDLGQQLAKNKFGLASGGNNVGLMKSVNDGHANADPDMPRYGIVPEEFRRFGLVHELIPEKNLIWVEDLYFRMRSFYELCDEFIVLPGGFGTLHELMDCLVHNQFGIISKRIFLLNFDKFWDPILDQFKVMVAKKALEQAHLDHLIVVNSTQELLPILQTQDTRKLSQGFDDHHWEDGIDSLTSIKGHDSRE